MMSKKLSPRINSCSFVGSFFELKQLPKDRMPQIAFAGRSNVGKSSLLNRVVGQKKMAKVSGTPGKTRSLNFFLVNENYYMVDLPGYGYAKVSKVMRNEWGRLIEDYLSKSEELVGLVLLIDCRRDPTEQDIQLLGWLRERNIPALISVTKTDKFTRDKTNRKVAEIEKKLGVSTIPFSSVTGTGKKELIGAIQSLIYEYYQDGDIN
jgi:GTP-binding protein